MSHSARFAVVVAVLAGFALALQYALQIAATLDTPGFVLSTLRFASFFTIQSNLLVAVVAAAAAREQPGRSGGFLRTPFARGGTALCIGVTALIYHFVLSATWAPQGAQWFADKLLHYVVPFAYLAWWLACAPHRQLRWGDPLKWLLFPAAFLAWTLLRGAWLHEYPYPFIDVDALGYALTLRNAVGVGALFVALGFAVVALDRAIGSSVRTPQ